LGRDGDESANVKMRNFGMPNRMPNDAKPNDAKRCSKDV